MNTYELEALDLFISPVKILRWKTEAGFNERLASVCGKIYQKVKQDRKRYMDYNLWSEEVPEIQELKQMFIRGISDSLSLYYRDEVRHEYQFRMHAWLRIDPPKTVIAPHNHLGVGLVGTYYCQTEIADERVHKLENNPFRDGDLVLFDPRPATRPSIAKEAPVVSITPEPGMMVLMPNYLVHWVNPVAEGDVRICIANNLTFTPREPIGISVVL
ncbi:MAG: hypothetical protein ING36_11285 [Burkholderiales bacterium]|nr:hypothetical protein [Burkholderiales bacterium]